jgi:tetratricopeptide (TPR) repeat protein
MGRLDAVEPWLELAEQIARTTSDERSRHELLATVARQRAMSRLAVADVRGAVELAREMVALRPVGAPEAGADTYFLGVCLFWTEARAEAESLLRAYLEATPEGEQDVRRVFAMALLAQAHAVRGELDAAEKLIKASLVTNEARGLDEHPPTEATYVASGVVLLARGDLEHAEARFEHATMLARRGGDRIEMAQALLWLARCRAAQGDRGGAEDAWHAAAAQLDGAHVPVLAEMERSDLGGYATVGSYLPSKHISIALVATFRSSAFDAQGNSDRYWTELHAKIGKVLAPRNAPLRRLTGDGSSRAQTTW